MPELPEVETIKLGLQRKIIGLTIKNLQVFYPKGVQFNPKLVQGKKVVGVWRRAKMLGIDLSPDARGPVGLYPHSMSSVASLSAGTQRETPSPATPRKAQSALTLLFHLKMTGQLIYVLGDGPQATSDERLIGGHPTPDMKGQMPNKSTVAVFEFSDKSKLYFNDQRRFGWIKLISDEPQAMSDKLFGKLGPEPFDPNFTWQILKSNLLHHKSMPVKVAIMDQSVVSGIGNIYASEALFDAKINPRRKIVSLSDSDFQALFKGIREALEMGIKHGGSTRAHFVNVDGEKGYFLDYANVYGKEGQKCHACSGKVEKIQQAGRGTYFCERCQK